MCVSLSGLHQDELKHTIIPSLTQLLQLHVCQVVCRLLLWAVGVCMCLSLSVCISVCVCVCVCVCERKRESLDVFICRWEVRERDREEVWWCKRPTETHTAVSQVKSIHSHTAPLSEHQVHYSPAGGKRRTLVARSGPMV